MQLPRLLALRLALLAIFAPALAQTVNYTWTGGAAIISQGMGSADATASGNWAGNTLPTSSATTTVLNFGASQGLSSYDILNVSLPGDFDVYGLVFTPPIPVYQFGSNSSGALGLGTGGLTLAGTGPGTVMLYSNLDLLGNQTWTINGNAFLYGRITESTPSALTIAGNGTGYIVLGNDSNTFSGGVDLQSGTLVVGGSSGKEGQAIFSGPVGTGTLTLRDNTTLRTTGYYDITLHNDIRLGNYVTLGDPSENNSITFGGTITPLQADTTLYLGTEGANFFSGSITDATVHNETSSTSLTFTSLNPYGSLSFAVLLGQNTYTGGTIADHAAVIFYSPGSIPETGDITARNQGYVSTGYNHLASGANGVGGITTILSHITDPANFNGSLGFDTDPDQSDIPTTFYDDINLSAFAPDGMDPQAGFWGLGSQTSAIITGHITPPDGGNFVFGGGEGKLYVQSNLGLPLSVNSAPNASPVPVGVRVRSVFGERPLTVWFQGDNSYTGNLMSDHSIVVLDSPNALPTNSQFSLDAQSYVGFTERFTAGTDTTVTPAEFISHLQTTGYNATSVLGFDSFDPSGRTIFSAVDLSALDDIYLGTTTHAHLAGAIRAPSSGVLSVTGVDGGWLTLDSALTPTVTLGEASVSGVDSLQIGMSGGSDTFQRGIVELTNGGSTYSGGTDIRSGYVLLGASSSGGDGSVGSGPLGTRTVNFLNSYSGLHTVLASSSNITLHNQLNFAEGTMVQFGVDSFSQGDEDRDPVSKLQDYTNYGISFMGGFSGYASELLFTGYGTFTLAGDSPNLTANLIQIGRAGYGSYYNVSGVNGGNYGTRFTTPLVIAASNTSFGSTDSLIQLSNGADLSFTSLAPTIGSIMGGDPVNYDGPNDSSYISLAADSTLTIHQSVNGELAATIGGAVSDRSLAYSSVAPVNAALVKNGSGSLTLSGQNNYSGGTTINDGSLIAGSSTVIDPNSLLITSGPLGTGTVTLNGGNLGFVNGATIANNIVFGANGGTLFGNTTFTQPLSIGSHVTLSPGNSPGIMSFANGLTFAGGGTLRLEIGSLYGTAGVDYDFLDVTGLSLAILATANNPFTFDLVSLTTDYSQPGTLASSALPASLTILQGAGQITGFDPAAFAFNTANFSSTTPGEFSVSLGNNGTSLQLNFTPIAVPEPSTYALFGLGALVFAVRAWRRRQSRA